MAAGNSCHAFEQRRYHGDVAMMLEDPIVNGQGYWRSLDICTPNYFSLTSRVREYAVLGRGGMSLLSLMVVLRNDFVSGVEQFQE